VSDIILRLTSISKRFGPAVTADELSLEVRRGEFFTFLGPSGSGKSTILRMVAGLEQPDSGRN
jgi:ABC-type Fe3+/spermidine/putrescine transport system ATPase subunit